MKFLIFFILLFTYFSTVGQSRFMVIANKKNAIFVLDTTHIKQRQLLSIDKGEHVLKCWAPFSNFITDNISVLSDTNIYLTKKFQYSQSYLEYKKNLKSYHLKRRGSILITSGFTIAAIFTSLNLDNKTDKSLKEAQTSKHNYERAISSADLNQFKTEYEDSKKEYENARTANNILKIVSAIIIPVGIASTIYFLKNTTLPEYHETPLLSRFDILLNNLDFSQPSASVTWKF